MLNSHGQKGCLTLVSILTAIFQVDLG